MKSVTLVGESNWMETMPKLFESDRSGECEACGTDYAEGDLVAWPGESVPWANRPICEACADDD